MSRLPAPMGEPGCVLLIGSVDAIEACWCLNNLGTGVVASALSDHLSVSSVLRGNSKPTAVLVLINEKGSPCLADVGPAVKTDISVTDDFSSAIYFAAWAAAETR